MPRRFIFKISYYLNGLNLLHGKVGDLLHTRWRSPSSFETDPTRPRGCLGPLSRCLFLSASHGGGCSLRQTQPGLLPASGRFRCSLFLDTVEFWRAANNVSFFSDRPTPTDTSYYVPPKHF